MGKVLVTIDTMAVDRDMVEIDGHQYSMRNHDELSLDELAELKRMSNSVKAIDPKDVSDEALNVLEGYSIGVLKIVMLDLPEDVARRLRRDQRLAIVNAFTHGASPKNPEEAPDQSSPESQQTTEG